MELKTIRIQRVVKQQNLASVMKSGSLDVLATPQIGSLTLTHSQNSQMSFMYGFFFVKFLIFAVVCVVIVI